MILLCLALTDRLSIIRSAEFHFLVGSERRRLTVHTKVIRNLSPPLFALINNGIIKESIEGCAVLDDVDENTFIGFCEFAYRGAYITPGRYEKHNDKSWESLNDASVKDEIASDDPAPTSC